MLNRAPFYRVTYRHKLFLSGEREPTMLATVLAIGVAILGFNLPSLIIGAILWFCAVPALRHIAKQDPQMMKVYLRNLAYPGYLPARSRPCIGDASRWTPVLRYALPVVLLAAFILRSLAF